MNMDPSAPSYTPSFSLRRKVRLEIPITSPSAGISPTVAPTAAERLRQLHPRPSPAQPSAGTTPSVSPAVVPQSAPPPEPPTVEELRRQRSTIRYTREELLAIEAPALEAIRNGPIADAPPLTKLPRSFIPLLSLPHAFEFVNIGAASALTEGRAYRSPGSGSGRFIVTAGDILPASTAAMDGYGSSSFLPAFSSSSALPPEVAAEQLHCYHCIECAHGGPRPCEALATVLHNARRYAMTQPLGRCLLQSPAVVWGQIQLALVFEAKQSSLRLRTLAEKFPVIPRKVGEFLYGEGYHLPLPKVTAHEEWGTAMQMLKFDAVRDSRTRVVTDVSKHWKKRHTQFEQFVFFFGYRDDVPRVEVKNMLTRSQKPGMVAMLSGDAVAMIILHHLGFFIPPDYYWSVFPFLEAALGEGTMTHDVVRHLGVFLSARQDPNMYNPIGSPLVNYIHTK